MKQSSTIMAYLALMLFFVIGCPQRKPDLIVGEEVDVVNDIIDEKGGTIVVDRPGDLLDGLTLEVPEGAYDNATAMEISYRPIENHTYGDNFHPVSPLICIKNGGIYAKRILKVKIPIAVPESNFAMAFLYDAATGDLQGMPMIKQEQDVLTVAAKHFSDVVVSSVAKSRLQGTIASEFQHGVDNWQFRNYGSYVAPGGHCSGQSLTAMYYFTEKKMREGKPALFGLYDNYNNPYHATPDIQEDDVLAYRLCSMVQNISKEVVLGDPEDYDIEELLLGEITPESTFNSFAYSMLVTGMPQYVSVYRTDDRGTVVGGHAMIVYKNVGPELFVSDPNFPHGPGSSERKIIFNEDNLTFEPYKSGERADEAEAKDVLYTEIMYVGGSDILNRAPLAKLWDEFEAGTVGQGTFPAYTLTLLEPNPYGSTDEVELNNNYQTYAEKIEVKVSTVDFEPRLTVYTVGQSGDTKGATATGFQTLVVPLSMGVNTLGFYVEGKNKEGGSPQDFEWVGFNWVTILKLQTDNDETYTCEIKIPRAGDHLLYRDDSQEWRAKVYRDGNDVTEELDWSSQAGFRFYYQSYYGTTYGDPWATIYNWNFDANGENWGDIKDGMVGFTGGLEAVSGPERPDQWESAIKFHLWAPDEKTCECFVNVIIEERRAD